ncbi:uncharacterized protein BDR25DRAFT_61962 [Lindgomyces ingoldianus]|uniref:Uncharacterized protein n=1 Tax=Lindgomyces ingoldianus TaxID=673940 RepID=A0ACB6QN52_9PLEO|nr:uncharacterized protein BDR25DRAFT_61962 [Lindgomyces ingoldianus]KAF2467727.1 hypothetical protein BDR25DRAFT_61962 [Lindgomyces ingoldianus]
MPSPQHFDFFRDGEWMEALIESIGQPILELKQERDMWKTAAHEYKRAFEILSDQLREFQDICFATQAELENERMLNIRRLAEASLHCDRKSEEFHGYGIADIQVRPQRDSTSTLDTNWIHNDWLPTSLVRTPSHHVNQLLIQGDIPTALAEVDVLLRGTLTFEARAETLLLKSAILLSSGSDWLCDALAQCSEALELCDRHSALESFLPKIRFHQGVCYFRLKMFQQALNAFEAVGPTDISQGRVATYMSLCRDELDAFSIIKRRSAFDEQRTYTEGYVSRFKEQERVVS